MACAKAQAFSMPQGEDLGLWETLKLSMRSSMHTEGVQKGFREYHSKSLILVRIWGSFDSVHFEDFMLFDPIPDCVRRAPARPLSLFLYQLYGSLDSVQGGAINVITLNEKPFCHVIYHLDWRPASCLRGLPHY